MKSRWIIGALLVTLMVCMVAPAMAQPAPFVISGHVSDSDNNPCNGTWVRITNTNTGLSWDAENDSTSNYYQLVLDSDNVSVNDSLQIEASGCSQSKTVEHTVTQSDINDGGFIQNITLEPAPSLLLDLEITDIWTELKRVGRNVNTTIIWYNITNNGDTTAGRTYSNLTVDDNPQPRNDGVGKLTPGQTRTEKFTYKGDPHNITVCADCRCVKTESNETNNCLSVTV